MVTKIQTCAKYYTVIHSNMVLTGKCSLGVFIKATDASSSASHSSKSKYTKIQDTIYSVYIDTTPFPGLVTNSNFTIKIP